MGVTKDRQGGRNIEAGCMGCQGKAPPYLRPGGGGGDGKEIHVWKKFNHPSSGMGGAAAMDW